METVRLFSQFVSGSVRLVTRGNRAYWAWLAFLGVLIVSGGLAYANQVSVGLSTSAMREGSRTSSW